MVKYFCDICGRELRIADRVQIPTAFDNDPASKAHNVSTAVVAGPKTYTKPASVLGGVSLSCPVNMQLHKIQRSGFRYGLHLLWNPDV